MRNKKLVDNNNPTNNFKNFSFLWIVGQEQKVIQIDMQDLDLEQGKKELDDDDDRELSIIEERE